MSEFIPLDLALDGQIIPLIPPPPKPPITTVLALSMGDELTPAAIVAVRYDAVMVTPGDAMFGELPVFETHYHVLGAETLTAGLSYPQVAVRVNTLARRLYNRDARGDYHALIDASGVGTPVVDAIRAAIIPQCCVSAVTVSDGDRGDLSVLWSYETSIGLAYLVSRVKAILQHRRLHVPSDPRLAGLLDAVAAYDLANDPGAGPVRALALACSSEYMPVRYDVGLDTIATPAL